MKEMKNKLVLKNILHIKSINVQFVLCLFLALGTVTTYAQETAPLIKEAKKELERFNYSKAINAYKEVLAIDSNNVKALDGVIELYLYQYELFDSAETYIKRYIGLTDKTKDLVIHYDYAFCLEMQEQHEDAIEEYVYFRDKVLPELGYNYLRPDVQMHIENCRNAIKNEAIILDDMFLVENMDFFVNSVDPEYTPVYLEKSGLL